MKTKKKPPVPGRRSKPAPVPLTGVAKVVEDARTAMQSAVLNALRTFESETGFLVQSVYLYRKESDDRYGRGPVTRVSCSVKYQSPKNEDDD
jgi:hypothetical protein